MAAVLQVTARYVRLTTEANHDAFLGTDWLLSLAFSGKLIVNAFGIWLTRFHPEVRK